MPNDSQVEALKIPPQSVGGRAIGAGGPSARQRGGGQGCRRHRRRVTSTAMRIASSTRRHQARRAKTSRPTSSPCRNARLGAEARLHRRPRLPRCAGRKRADGREHPPLRGDRPRAVDLAATRPRWRHRRNRDHPLGRSAEEILDQAEAKVCRSRSRASAGSSSRRSAAPRGSWSGSKALQPRRSVRSHGHGTGFTDLDEKTSGLQPGDLVIVAGRRRWGRPRLRSTSREHVALTPRCPSRYSGWKWAQPSSRCG